MWRRGVLSRAQAQIVVADGHSRMRHVRRNIGVARDAEALKREIREQSAAATGDRAVVVAGKAIALIRAQVNAIAPELRGRERHGLAIAELDEERVVVLAGIGVETGI